METSILKSPWIACYFIALLTISCGRSNEGNNAQDDSTNHDTIVPHPVPEAYMYGQLQNATPPFDWGQTDDTANYDPTDIGYTLVAEFKSLKPSTVLNYVKTQVISPNETIIAQYDSSIFWDHNYMGDHISDKLECHIFVKCVPFKNGSIVRVSNDEATMTFNEGVLDLIRTGIK